MRRLTSPFGATGTAGGFILESGLRCTDGRDAHVPSGLAARSNDRGREPEGVVSANLADATGAETGKEFSQTERSHIHTSPRFANSQVDPQDSNMGDHAAQAWITNHRSIPVLGIAPGGVHPGRGLHVTAACHRAQGGPARLFLAM